MQVSEVSNPEALVPLMERWYTKSNVNEFGMDVTVESALEDLKRWVKEYPNVMLQAKHKGKLVGMIIVFALDNWMSSKPIAVEKYWYGQGGLELYRAAKKWAKDNGCSHFIASASHFAGGRHDRVKRLCEKLGMNLFETSYITEV